MPPTFTSGAPLNVIEGIDPSIDFTIRFRLDVVDLTVSPTLIPSSPPKFKLLANARVWLPY